VWPRLIRLEAKARDYALHARAESTLRSYRTVWRYFRAWCKLHERTPLPALPETLALYLADRSDELKVATLQRHLAAIGEAHRTAGHPSPAEDAFVRAVWSGIRRTKGVAPEGKAPALTEDVRLMVDTLPESLMGTRDRALLLLGFAGAFRRSELVALDRRDLQITSAGITVTLRRSKTDQEGAGRKVGIPYGSRPHTCPVRSLLAWLEDSRITEGPVFRRMNRHGHLLPHRLSDRGVARIVQRCAEAAGLDPALYAGHSLRAGHSTSAAMAGASERSIMKQTGHTSAAMVRKYIRMASLFQENSAADLGL
jgi:integrase